MRVPALCDTCGAFFDSGVEVSNSTNITFGQTRAGPCPRCGNLGHIPDGTYNFIGNTIELLSGPARSRSDLERLADILKAARTAGGSPEEVRDQIRKEVPELSSIADLLPKTRNEFYGFLAILVSILTLILGEIRRGEQPKVEVNQIINQITRVVSAPPAPAPKVGRNDLCPCGSGKKYKRCHALQP